MPSLEAPTLMQLEATTVPIATTSSDLNEYTRPQLPTQKTAANVPLTINSISNKMVM